MSKSRKNRKQDPNVALFVDEVEKRRHSNSSDEPLPKRSEYRNTSDDEIDNHTRSRRNQSPREVEKMRRQQEKTGRQREKQQRVSDKKMKKQKKKQRKSGFSRFIKKTLIIILLLQTPMLYGIFRSYDFVRFDSTSNVRGTKGILLLGVDNLDGAKSLKSTKGGHTDSITYLAVNTKTKHAISMPIYRDSYVYQTCTGTFDNVNRIYQNEGVKCLAESISNTLNLPVDAYGLVSMKGLIDVVNRLGGVDISPTGSFCSNYGEDGVLYCYEYGETKRMKGPESLAYIRYRGGGNGEIRANRQTELIGAIRNRCMSNVAMCYIKVAPSLGGKFKTNVSPSSALAILSLMSDDFEVEKMDVIRGTNTEIETGWTEFLDEYDLETKTSYIREKIFS